MVERADVFVEQLAIHSMLAAGTPGVQGVAPKFLLTQAEEGRWFPDTALPAARARRPWPGKRPPARPGPAVPPIEPDSRRAGDTGASTWVLPAAPIHNTTTNPPH